MFRKLLLNIPKKDKTFVAKLSVFGAIIAITSLPITSLHASNNYFNQNNLMPKNIYGTASIGVNMPQKFSGTAYQNFSRPKKNLTYNLALGYSFNESFQADISLHKIDISAKSNTANNSIKSEYENIVSFANGYINILNFDKFTPYLAAGIGVARLQPKITSPFQNTSRTEKFKNDQNFAWQLGTGIRHELSSQINLDISYKYMDLGQNKLLFNDNLNYPQSSGLNKYFNTKLRTHTINIGLTYSMK